jgi:hypothetical protein
MRLLPRSLFARMVLILLGGLVAAQLLSFAIHWQERGEFIMRATGMGSAQRIADIVRLLDSIAPAERAKIVSVLSSPPLRISLGEPSLAPVAGDAGKEDQAAQYAGVLKRALGEDYPIAVTVTDVRPWSGPGPGYGMGPGMMRGPGAWGPDAGSPGQFGPGAFRPGMHRYAGISFVVQARLKDGALVTFDSRQPLGEHIGQRLEPRGADRVPVARARILAFDVERFAGPAQEQIRRLLIERVEAARDPVSH